jgi:hypothetical protein
LKEINQEMKENDTKLNSKVNDLENEVKSLSAELNQSNILAREKVE